MSRKRLIGSLTVGSCCLALVIALAAWAFPLKGAPLATQSAPKTGVTGGVSGAISGGVSGGVGSGVSGGITGGIVGGVRDAEGRSSIDEPNVDISTIWVDTVKKGTMPLQVRGSGTLVSGEGSSIIVVRVNVPASMAAGVKVGENATVLSKNGLGGRGQVTRIGWQSADTRTVEITLGTALPGGVTGTGLEVTATITIGRLDNVLYVGRPVNGAANAEIGLYKIIRGGSEAVLTQVKLGRPSANTIEVLSGLKEGDKVILSDMSSVDSAERVRLTDEKHPGLAQTVPAQDAVVTRVAARAQQASSPSCRYCPNPEYPEEARKEKIPSAAVLLEVTVLETGNVDEQSVKVTKDPGHGFAAKAVEAVKTWKFNPSLKDGKPVKAKTAVEVAFRLKA